jgi:phosphatidylserine/phosphatidylglycerophosphate/cardiolipin synthase-like enzyme
MKKIITIILLCLLHLICYAPFAKRYYTLIQHIKERSQRRIFDTYVYAAFPPRDEVKPLLCNLIDEEMHRIDVAMYQFTEKDLAQSLIHAHQRGVIINLVSDRGLNHYSQVLALRNVGVSTWVWPLEERERRDALMHNKYMLLHSLYCVVTGSMNFTQSATKINQENVVIMQDKDIFKQYANHFESLIRGSSRL